MKVMSCFVAGLLRAGMRCMTRSTHNTDLAIMSLSRSCMAQRTGPSRMIWFDSRRVVCGCWSPVLWRVRVGPYRCAINRLGGGLRVFIHLDKLCLEPGHLSCGLRWGLSWPVGSGIGSIRHVVGCESRLRSLGSYRRGLLLIKLNVGLFLLISVICAGLEKWPHGWARTGGVCWDVWPPRYSPSPCIDSICPNGPAWRSRW